MSYSDISVMLCIIKKYRVYRRVESGSRGDELFVGEVRSYLIITTLLPTRLQELTWRKSLPWMIALNNIKIQIETILNSLCQRSKHTSQPYNNIGWTFLSNLPSLQCIDRLSILPFYKTSYIAFVAFLDNFCIATSKDPDLPKVTAFLHF